ncbi:MAG: family protein RssA, partial [Pseudomonadota bacterium]
AARGFAHVGVIQVLEEAGIQPDLVVGTSAGSLVAALYASGKNSTQLRRVAETMEEAEITDWMMPILNRGALRGEALARYVNTQVGGRLIEQMKIPLGIVATDLHNGEPMLFQRGNTGSAVRASSAVPAVFQPVKIGAREYVDGGLVTFNNTATGYDPVLNVAVAPSSTVFNHDAINSYSLTGTGSIGGIGSLKKQGGGTLTMGLVNTYTGATILEGGTLTVDALANGGIASAIGASSASSNNLVFAGGTLDYSGPATSINRGYTVDAATNLILSTLSIDNDLTLSGQVTMTSVGRFQKTGAGVLTLTYPGANVLAMTGDNDATPGYVISQGGLVLAGAGTQTNAITGQFRLGTTASNTTALTLDSSTLTVNGPSMASLGDDSISTITIGGAAVYQANGRFNVGYGANSVANVIVEGSGTLNKVGGWLSVGNSSNATGFMTVKDNGSVNSNGDFNVSDVGTSTGTLTIEGAGTVNSSGPMFIGKNGGTTGTLNLSSGTLNVTANFYVAREATSIGTATQTGGSSTMGGTGEVFIGADGSGTYTLSGGTMAANGWSIYPKLYGS